MERIEKEAMRLILDVLVASSSNNLSSNNMNKLPKLQT